ncbi:hypothetical protein K503DRAFT_806447 [Rhizopogon vinicolor AM-OR11-026]|uniref:Uncharacterized protein n=1 Tax=Rhizopogon vinicolor AM-OR11-026 TaxID=1314800 RepID=A0A1B7MEK9_9AGAM|nr:hypothetical protein K503DRAFT_806447 [Rhizopogon vinicolor AM-OR11-026]
MPAVRQNSVAAADALPVNEHAGRGRAFRFEGKHAFLTYAQAGELQVANLVAKFTELGALSWVIGKEEHQDLDPIPRVPPLPSGGPLPLQGSIRAPYRAIRMGTLKPRSGF